MNFFWLTLFALCFDLVVGDSIWIVHPVALIGKWISFFDGLANRPNKQHIWLQRCLGVMLVVTTLLLCGLASLFVLHLAAMVAPWLALVCSILVISVTIAWKGLMDAGRSVYRALCHDGLEQARACVALIVGRDTAELAEPGIIRAAIETLAENIVDALVSPVFYACMGGPVLAIIYRAINTLDSMVGYKNDRYRDFGWASARLDDLANYIPARITIGLLTVVFWVCRYDAVGAWRVLRNDAAKHPSPNSGIPEAMVAGALGIELGGTNTYFGVRSERAKMGSPGRLRESRDIQKTITVVRATGLTLMVLMAIGGITWWLYFDSLFSPFNS